MWAYFYMNLQGFMAYGTCRICTVMHFLIRGAHPQPWRHWLLTPAVQPHVVLFFCFVLFFVHQRYFSGRCMCACTCCCGWRSANRVIEITKGFGAFLLKCMRGSLGCITLPSATRAQSGTDLNGHNQADINTLFTAWLIGPANDRSLTLPVTRAV